jgi:hypothetical protein
MYLSTIVKVINILQVSFAGRQPPAFVTSFAKAPDVKESIG